MPPTGNFSPQPDDDEVGTHNSPGADDSPKLTPNSDEPLPLLPKPLTMTFEAIILAAGQGVRMRSSLPKTLHPIGGRPMLSHIIAAVNALAPSRIHVVVGAQGDQVRAAIEDDFANLPSVGFAPKKKAAEQDVAHAPLHGTPPHAADPNLVDKINWVVQKKQLGTGHAALQAMPAVHLDSSVLLLYGDTPLLSAATLQPLLALENARNAKNAIGLLTATVANPTGMGRIVRDERGRVTEVVEEKDASDAVKQIRECNLGVVAGPAGVVAAGLDKLDDENAQREFYLTDIIRHAANAGAEIIPCPPATLDEVIGVNSQTELAQAERIYQREQARHLLEQGVRLQDPARFDLRGCCQFGRDCVVDVNVILQGRVVVGDGCVLGANTIIRDSHIGAGSVVAENCVIDQAVVGAHCKIGPFARLRPQTTLARAVHIGNFVEIKKSRIGPGSKANHLSYIGDSTLGQGVNIGAGVITCNYDGAEKHHTDIGDNVFVGSNSQLVAPLVIGHGATIGAGSTITDNVAADTLAVSRAAQKVFADWTRPVKKCT